MDVQGAFGILRNRLLLYVSGSKAGRLLLTTWIRSFLTDRRAGLLFGNTYTTGTLIDGAYHRVDMYHPSYFPSTWGL